MRGCMQQRVTVRACCIFYGADIYPFVSDLPLSDTAAVGAPSGRDRNGMLRGVALRCCGVEQQQGLEQTDC